MTRTKWRPPLLPPKHGGNREVMSRTLLRVVRELSCVEEPGDVGAAEGGSYGPPALILAPPGCGISGLMFMAAALAAEEEGAVLYLSPEPLQTVPRAGRAAQDPLILKQIRFVYPPSMKELLQFFSSLHLMSPPPSLILVDGLERYLPPACSLHDAAHVSALMLDSISHVHCGLLVSAAPNPEGTDWVFQAVERYFPNQCLVYHDISTGGKEQVFKMSFMSPRPQWNLHIKEDGSIHISPHREPMR
ncbi:ATPase SWSAP1 [Rhinoderma darwinii]|uniref:ATPase SWSAP1 n=1 Tax=Rhinoderma darwinii TaxID=43563 RepID=UPI003F660C7E